MSMFDNYPSPEGYVPDNTTKKLPEEVIVPYSIPMEERNIEGVLIGYSWREGDTLVMPYEVDDYIKEGIEEKTILISILDHNRKVVHDEEVSGSATVNIEINNDIASKLIRGNYYFTFKVFDDTSTYISSEFMVIVK